MPGSARAVSVAALCRSRLGARRVQGEVMIKPSAVSLLIACSIYDDVPLGEYGVKLEGQAKAHRVARDPGSGVRIESSMCAIRGDGRVQRARRRDDRIALERELEPRLASLKRQSDIVYRQGSLRCRR